MDREGGLKKFGVANALFVLTGFVTFRENFLEI